MKIMRSKLSVNKVIDALKLLKKPKYLLILGIAGIILIAVSSLFQIDNKKNTSSVSDNFDSEEYLETVEKSVSNIVYGITGDKKATVVVTLENGVRYSYADDTVNDTNSTKGENSNQSSTKTQSSHITVKTASGEEKALIVTTKMPEIRGVAIICDYGDEEAVNEKITNAVTAALNITSKRVFVSGKF